MTDAPPDVPLRATELQMRRALGLDRKAPPASQPTHSSTPSNGLHQRRHFVRDGEVPTTVIHSDRGSRLQQLEAMRQALQERDKSSPMSVLPNTKWLSEPVPSGRGLRKHSPRSQQNVHCVCGQHASVRGVCCSANCGTATAAGNRIRHSQRCAVAGGVLPQW